VRELERSGKERKPPTPEETARQWAAVHRYASTSAFEAGEDGAAPSGWRTLAAASPYGASGFGFEASIGAARGPQSLQSLEGLSEGFRSIGS
jgi:hypothetical protein